MKSFRRMPLLALSALALFALSACTKNTGKKLDINSDQIVDARGGGVVLDRKPSDPNSIESRLMKRWEGQNDFLSWHQQINDLPIFALETQMRAMDKGGAPAREIKFSDVYAIGPEGEKTVILLNNLGGLQLVKYFEGDAKRPQLIGEVEPTYNNPKDMYYDATTKYAYVLENDFSDRNSWWARNRNSRVLVYDLTDAAAPKLLMNKSKELRGELSDSRMVGNEELGEVLYVVTQEHPYNWWSTGASHYTGRVYSLTLNGSEVSFVQNNNSDAYRLKGRVSTYQRNLNIIQDGSNFYLVAILQGGWRSSDEIEVLDISDPKGSVSPVMTVTARGDIRERSSTVIKDGVLIVASQYRPQGDTRDHIAVEAFKFPTENSSIISKSVAERNLAWLKVELEKGKDYDEAVKNSVFGLAGKFAKFDIRRFQGNETYRLHKFVADFSDIIEPVLTEIEVDGPRTEVSAILEDTRTNADGTRLYVMWRPGPVDPLDVYDISDIQNKMPHVGHTEFRGFVTRAFPTSFGDQDYIIGLGHKEARWGGGTPTAYLFKMNEVVTEEEGNSTLSVEAPIVSEMTLTDNISANFNTEEDKEIAAPQIDDKTGMGRILFEINNRKVGDVVTAFSGGQLIGVDLSKAPKGANNDKVDGVFTQGALIAATDGERLVRTFANTEIENGFNTFTEKRLGTFIVAGVGELSKDPVQAASILELTRSVRAYASVDADSGVQIVSNEEGNATELRLVPAKHADMRLSAEADKQMPRVVVETGRYNSHVLIGNNLIVLTSKYGHEPERKIELEDGSTAVVAAGYYRRVSAHKAKIEADKIELVSSVTWKAEVVPRFGRGGFFGGPRIGRVADFRRGGPWWWYEPAAANLIITDGKVVSDDNGDLRYLDLSAAKGSQHQIDATNCTPKVIIQDSTDPDPKQVAEDESPEYSTVSLSNVDGAMFASYSELVADPSRKYKREKWGPDEETGEWKRTIEESTFKYARRFVATAKLGELAEGKMPLVCERAVNVPGTIVSYHKQGDKEHLIVEENRVVDIKENRREDTVDYSPVTRKALLSLKIEQVALAKTATANLASMYDPGDVAVTAMKRLDPHTFVFVESENYRSDLAILSLDSELKFRKDYKAFEWESNDSDSDLGSVSSLTIAPSNSNESSIEVVFATSAVDQDKSSTSHYAIIQSGVTAQVVGFSLDHNREFVSDVSVKRLKEAQLDGTFPESDNMSFYLFKIMSPRIYRWGYSPRNNAPAKFNFNKALGTFEIALEEFGIKQLKVGN